jgi:hypothetical protein
VVNFRATNVCIVSIMMCSEFNNNNYNVTNAKKKKKGEVEDYEVKKVEFYV